MLTFSGCQVGKTWFQMDSNSGSPFFGLDLMPRRKTTQLTPSNPAHSAPINAQSQVQPVSQRKSRSFKPRGRTIELPRFALPFGSSRESELDQSVQFPEPIEFHRGRWDTVDKENSDTASFESFASSVK